jgi:hypothetical protein
MASLLQLPQEVQELSSVEFSVHSLVRFDAKVHVDDTFQREWQVVIVQGVVYQTEDLLWFADFCQNEKQPPCST